MSRSREHIVSTPSTTVAPWRPVEGEEWPPQAPATMAGAIRRKVPTERSARMNDLWRSWFAECQERGILGPAGRRCLPGTSYELAAKTGWEFPTPISVEFVEAILVYLPLLRKRCVRYPDLKRQEDRSAA